MKKTILNVLSIVVALLMILFGLNKFFNFIPLPEMPEEVMQLFAHFEGIAWLMPLVGIAEVLGGLLLISRKTRALGALILFPVVVGILIQNLMYTPAESAIPVVVSLVVFWIIADNCEKYLPMIRD